MQKLPWIKPDFKLYDKSVTATAIIDAPAESDATNKTV